MPITHGLCRQISTATTGLLVWLKTPTFHGNAAIIDTGATAAAGVKDITPFSHRVYCADNTCICVEQTLQMGPTDPTAYSFPTESLGSPDWQSEMVHSKEARPQVDTGRGSIVAPSIALQVSQLKRNLQSGSVAGSSTKDSSWKSALVERIAARKDEGPSSAGEDLASTELTPATTPGMATDPGIAYSFRTESLGSPGWAEKLVQSIEERSSSASSGLDTADLRHKESIALKVSRLRHEVDPTSDNTGWEQRLANEIEVRKRAQKKKLELLAKQATRNATCAPGERIYVFD